jgi:hypothetical protein
MGGDLAAEPAAASTLDAARPRPGVSRRRRAIHPRGPRPGQRPPADHRRPCVATLSAHEPGRSFRAPRSRRGALPLRPPSCRPPTLSTRLRLRRLRPVGLPPLPPLALAVALGPLGGRPRRLMVRGMASTASARQGRPEKGRPCPEGHRRADARRCGPAPEESHPGPGLRCWTVGCPGLVPRSRRGPAAQAFPAPWAAWCPSSPWVP